MPENTPPQKNARILKVLQWSLLTALLVYLVTAGLALALQRHIIYHPTDKWVTTPESLNLERAHYKTADGIALTGWYCPPRSDDRPTLVMFHGNGGNLSHRYKKQMFFCTRGYGFLSAAYRGYSGNAGKPREPGFYADARAALNWVKNTAAIPPKNIILYGESIGTGVAVQMALEGPPPRALILESPYTALPDLVNSHFPWLIPFKGFIADKFETATKAPVITAPTLVIHGTADRVIPPAQGIAVYDALRQAPKTLKLIKGAGHNNLAAYGALADMDDFVTHKAADYQE